MSTAHVAARDFLRERKGSLRAHQDLQRAVLDYCALQLVPAIAVHTGPRVAPRADGRGFDLRANPEQRGLSDVVLCLPPFGRMALLELKTGGARRSPEQVRLHERFTRAGALCLVVRSVREIEPFVSQARGWAMAASPQGGPR